MVTQNNTAVEKSYKQSIDINTSSKAAYNALTKEISEWWGDTDQITKTVGDRFKVSWGEPYYQFEVVELEPNEKIKWDCIDCNQIHEGLEGIEKEWVGTKLFWTIEDLKNGQTRVTLLHEGLVPSFICYEVCHSGWDHFIKDSLKGYLEGS